MGLTTEGRCVDLCTRHNAYQRHSVVTYRLVEPYVLDILPLHNLPDLADGRLAKAELPTGILEYLS